MNATQRHASLSDRELVTLAESHPVFQHDGIEREVLLRLAHCVGHALAHSDPSRVRRLTAGTRRYNDSRRG